MERRTSTITLAALSMLCLLGLVFGVRAVTADLPGDGILKEPEASCEDRVVTAGSMITTEEVTVSVFNAGGRSGLASKTLQELIERGFARGDSGNARATEVKRAQVWANSADNPAAQLVVRHLGPGIRVHTDQPVLGDGVVVVLGKEFTTLAKKAPNKLKVATDATICSPPL